MTRTAERNAAIKNTLAQAFGRSKVSVKGSRGTAYGWVSIYIDWTPLDVEARREMETQVKALLRAAKIDLGHSYTDDTCQYESDQCHISFNLCRYFRTMKHADGAMSAIRDYHDSNWEIVQARQPAIRPGDAASIMHDETGLSYEQCLVMTNTD